VERRGGSWSAGERESLDRWRFWNEKLSKEDVYRNTSTLWLVKAYEKAGSHTHNDDVMRAIQADQGVYYWRFRVALERDVYYGKEKGNYLRILDVYKEVLELGLFG